MWLTLQLKLKAIPPAQRARLWQCARLLAALTHGIIAVGNAPTALTEAIKLCTEGIITPDLIIGMPVGFVGAAESKQQLFSSGLVLYHHAGTEREGLRLLLQ